MAVPLYFAAVLVIDAMFKIPEGIPEGKLHWIGAFEYCHDTHVEYTYNVSGVAEAREYDGQYTRLDLTLYAVRIPSSQRLF